MQEKTEKPSHTLTSLIRKALNSVLAYDCILCGVSSNNNSNLCHTCTQDLPYILQPCEYCGIETIQSASESLCGPCALKKPVFNQCISLTAYESPVEELIGRHKFNANFTAGVALGEILAAKFKHHCECNGYPDAIIAIPLHQSRLRERGFNQSIELAKQLSKLTSVPLLRESLFRVKNTQPQTEIKRARLRKSNLRGAFACSGFPHNKLYKHIALVDDVVTTGATMNEAARALFLVGIERVDCFCVARVSR